MAKSMENGKNASFWSPNKFLTHEHEQLLHLQNQQNTTTSYDELLLLNSGFGLGSNPLYSTHLNSQQLHSTSRHLQRPFSGEIWKGNRTGSPTEVSGFPSPELENDVGWDLLYEAASKVARMKMDTIVAQLNSFGISGVSCHQTPGFNPASNLSNKRYEDLKWAHEINHLKRQENEIDICNCHRHNNHQQRQSYGGPLVLQQSSRPPVRTRQITSCGSQLMSMNQFGSVKRRSTGTGVFLPRSIPTSPPRRHHQPPLYSAPNRKPSGLNMKIENANLNPQSRFSTDHELMMMHKKNAMLKQHRKTGNNTAEKGGYGHEIRLPNDWTY